VQRSPAKKAHPDSVTDRGPGAYDPAIARILPVLLVALALAACGGGAQRTSTLPPPPGAAGSVALWQLSHHPEVYADATVSTVGAISRVRIGHKHLLALHGAGGAPIVLEPTKRFAHIVGRRVRVSGLFAVTFEIGYEILASQVSVLGR
jgi:hypothetical protein